MENEFDRDQFERFPGRVECDGIDKFEVIGTRQRAPGVFFRSKVQIQDCPMLQQVKSPLPTPDLLELLLRNLALLEQKVARFLLESISIEAHGIGTSISFLLFSGKSVL